MKGLLASARPCKGDPLDARAHRSGQADRTSRENSIGRHRDSAQGPSNPRARKLFSWARHSATSNVTPRTLQTSQTSPPHVPTLWRDPNTSTPHAPTLPYYQHPDGSVTTPNACASRAELTLIRMRAVRRTLRSSALEARYRHLELCGRRARSVTMRNQSYGGLGWVLPLCYRGGTVHPRTQHPWGPHRNARRLQSRPDVTPAAHTPAPPVTLRRRGCTSPEIRQQSQREHRGHPAEAKQLERREHPPRAGSTASPPSTA